MEFIWGFDTDFDSALRVARYVGLTSIAIAGAVVVSTILLRVLFLMQTVRRNRVLASWRPIWAACIMDDSEIHADVQLSRRDHRYFLEEWNNLHTQLRGEATESLNHLANRLQIDTVGVQMVRSGNRYEELLGIVTLGHMAVRQAWDLLVPKLNDADPVLSLAIARSLLLIDATKAVPLVIQEALCRSDWPLVRLASILKDVGPARACGPLSEQLKAAKPNQLTTLLHLIQVLGCRSSLESTLEALESNEDEETIIVCLQILDDPRGLSLVRWYAQDERWAVRLQAARTLGRLGSVSDVSLLRTLLTDEQWWVRYRAAEALRGLPFLEESDLRQFLAECESAAARDILEQVIAEGQFA